MHPSSIWSSDGLVPLPPVEDQAWLSSGIQGTNVGAAVGWLADAGRRDGWVRLDRRRIADDTTLVHLPGTGKALMFADDTFLLAQGDGRVFPAPFIGTQGLRPKPTAMARRLADLGDWPKEWRHGPKQGLLAPAFLPFETVLGPADETSLANLGTFLLGLLRAEHCRMVWISQPVFRSGDIGPPNFVLEGPPAALQHGLYDASARVCLQALWEQGYPIPALPGQTLHNGMRMPIVSTILSHAPPMASAHERLRLYKDPAVQELRVLLHSILEPDPEDVPAP